MAKYVKVGGTWKQVSPDVDSNIYANIKVGGSWKDITAAYIKVNGTWRQYWNYSAYIVPNVVGQNYLTAQTAITGSGNTVGTLTTLANAQGATPQNDKTVASQTVSAGKYTTQQTVGLSYYVFTYVTVPNIVGQTVSTGQTLVQNSGNTWGTGSYYNNAQGATAGNNNTILSQSPAAGQYTTAQTVNYGYYLYTVPTPSGPTVTLNSKTATSFNFSVSYGSNTTSANAYYGPSGNPTQTFLGAVSNGGSVSATGLSPNTTYQFVAYAYNTVNVNTLGNQTTGPVAGNVGSVTTDNIPAPSQPSLTVTTFSTTTISVSVTPGANTTSYNVYYGTSYPPTTYYNSYVAGALFTISNLNLGTGYYIQAIPYNSGVQGTAGYVYQVTSSSVTAATPYFSGYGSTTSSATFYWAPAVNGSTVSYYNIDYTSVLPYTPFAWSTSTGTSYTINGTGTFYFFIQAVSSTGNTSSWVQSSPITVTAGVAPNAPSPHLTYAAGPSWTPSFNYSTVGTGAITYYWYFYTANDSAGTGQILQNSGSVISTASGALYSSAAMGGPFGNGGSGQVWGQLQVTAINSYGSATGYSGWV